MTERWRSHIKDKIIISESVIVEFEKVFTCRTCNGTGIIFNPDFEMCEDKDNQKIYGIKPVDCDHCDRTNKNTCKRGERITCTNDCCTEGMEMLSFKDFMKRYVGRKD